MRKTLPADFLSLIEKNFPKDFLQRSEATCAQYGDDWSKTLTIDAAAIAFPRSTQEVSKLLALTYEFNLAVVPSGGRTGLAGGASATNGEIVLSLERMNKMGEVDVLGQSLHVEAGAITELVHQHCEAAGLLWPIDFAAKGSSHIGGNLSTNAGGVKVIHYGMSRNWVLGLEVVLPNGEILSLDSALEKNNTGLDLRQLFVGTEGTLGIITAAILKLTRPPESLQSFFFAVKDTASVFQLFLEARKGPFKLMAFECLSEACLKLVETKMSLLSPLQTRGGAYVLLEAEVAPSDAVREAQEKWLEQLFTKEIVLDGTMSQSPREARNYWAIREGVPEALFMAGYVHKNDISVSVSKLEGFITELDTLFAAEYKGIETYTFGHIGDGNLHLNALRPDHANLESFQKHCHTVDEKLFQLVKKYSGSISAEHGIGLLKKDFLHFSRSEREIEIFRGIKKLLDPKNLLNPGKIIDPL